MTRNLGIIHLRESIYPQLTNGKDRWNWRYGYYVYMVKNTYSNNRQQTYRVVVGVEALALWVEVGIGSPIVSFVNTCTHGCQLVGVGWTE